jgi:hypothetical protein
MHPTLQISHERFFDISYNTSGALVIGVPRNVAVIASEYYFDIPKSPKTKSKFSSKNKFSSLRSLCM